MKKCPTCQGSGQISQEKEEQISAAEMRCLGVNGFRDPLNSLVFSREEILAIDPSYIPKEPYKKRDRKPYLIKEKIIAQPTLEEIEDMRQQGLIWNKKTWVSLSHKK